MAARGFSGDTMSTLLMIGAGVLVWNRLSSTAEKGANKLADVLEIGKNSAGIFQAETTAEISVYEAEVKGWYCDWKALGAAGKNKTRAIANKIAAEARDGADLITNLDEDLILDLLRPLSANELRAVAIQFGVLDINHAWGSTAWTGHIFHFFDTTFTDSFIGGNDMTEMRKIWAKTGLWI